MKTKNELTFGTKISDALHLATVLAGIEKYKAPRETETLEQYQQLISSTGASLPGRLNHLF